MNKDIEEIKIILADMKKSVEKLIRIELSSIDEQMNNLLSLIAEGKIMDENTKKNVIDKVAKLHKIYIDLCLALYDMVDKSEYENEELVEAAIMMED